jgi:hypothetical protein
MFSMLGTTCAAAYTFNSPPANLDASAFDLANPAMMSLLTCCPTPLLVLLMLLDQTIS